jgi:hypothetical protein
MDAELSTTSLAICLGLSEYVRHNWKGDTVQRFEALELSPLELALKFNKLDIYPITINFIGDTYIDPDTVIALLDLGCDLNYMPPEHRQSVGMDFLGTILDSRLRIKSRRFLSEENFLKTLRILFSRKLEFPQLDAVCSGPTEAQRQKTLTRDIVEQKLHLLFGMAMARELMALCANPAPSADGASC